MVFQIFATLMLGALAEGIRRAEMSEAFERDMRRRRKHEAMTEPFRQASAESLKVYNDLKGTNGEEARKTAYDEILARPDIIESFSKGKANIDRKYQGNTNSSDYINAQARYKAAFDTNLSDAELARMQALSNMIPDQYSGLNLSRDVLKEMTGRQSTLLDPISNLLSGMSTEDGAAIDKWIGGKLSPNKALTQASNNSNLPYESSMFPKLSRDATDLEDKLAGYNLGL